MSLEQASAGSPAGASGEFRTTHWSIVLQAGGDPGVDSACALERLCQSYWYPLYAFARRKGLAHEAAQDATQAFFTKLLEKRQISLADPRRGRFRSFLQHAMENFLRSLHRDATTKKRGGGAPLFSLDVPLALEKLAAEPSGHLTEAGFFDKQWAGTVLEAALERLRREFAKTGRRDLFELLEPHLWGDDTSTPYAEIARSMDLTTVAVRVTVHRLRQRFHAVLREEVAHTLENPAEVDEELRHLRRALAS